MGQGSCYQPPPQSKPALPAALPHSAAAAADSKDPGLFLEVLAKLRPPDPNRQYLVLELGKILAIGVLFTSVIMAVVYLAVR